MVILCHVFIKLDHMTVGVIEKCVSLAMKESLVNSSSRGRVFPYPHFSFRLFLEGSMSNFFLRKVSPKGNGNVGNVSLAQNT